MRKLFKFRCPACDAVVESVLITQLQKQNAELLKAASAAEEFLRTFEPEWEILTDGDHGPWDGAKHAKKLRLAIEAGAK